MALESATYISQLVNTNPPGTDDADTTDDHFRLIKDVLLNTLGALSGAVLATHTEINRICDGIVATAAEVNALQTAFGGKTTTSTDDKVDNFPATTAEVFYQAAAPTGWTKSVTHNDKSLRVVSGTGGGSGGSVAFSTVFGRTATDAHQLTIAEMPAHTHRLPYSVLALSAGSGNNVQRSAFSEVSESTGGDGTHSHNIDLQLQYIDVIIATKD